MVDGFDLDQEGTLDEQVGPQCRQRHAAIRERHDDFGLERQPGVLQFHGEETPEFCRQFAPLKVVKAFRIQNAASLQPLPDYAVDAWLLDSYVPGHRGGTGEKFNWELAAQAKELGRPVILAGGLSPENIADAMQQVWPFGVDVSSGVERTRGEKDPAKIEEFVARVRALQE